MAFDDRTQHAARRDELYQDPQYQDPFRTQWNGAAGTTGAGAGAGATYAADPQPWESRTSLDTRHDTERHAGEYRDNSPIEMRPLVKDYNASDALDSTQQQPPIAPTVREQLLFASGVDRFLRLIHKGKSENLTQAIHRKRMGIGGQRWPIITWGLTASKEGLAGAALTASHDCVAHLRAHRQQERDGKRHFHVGACAKTSRFSSRCLCHAANCAHCAKLTPAFQLHDRPLVAGADQHRRALRPVSRAPGDADSRCIKPVAAIPPSFSMTCVDGKYVRVEVRPD
jgi:hypothetical protein